MKRIRSLDRCPPGLDTYLFEGLEDTRNWDGFRSQEAGESYLELIERLIDRQHGLCGYCEINIRETDRQVEHVVPQSDPQHGTALLLDYRNMIACCKGGTLQTSDKVKCLDPVRCNLSCGEAKGDLVSADFIDPRTLPDLPSLTRVNFDGRMEADANSCKIRGVDTGRVERTIKILGLNVERLRRAREDRWNALSETWNSDIEDPEIMKAAAREELLPDKDNRLAQFFTTRRSYFDVYAESVLSGEPRDWI